VADRSRTLEDFPIHGATPGAARAAEEAGSTQAARSVEAVEVLEPYRDVFTAAPTPESLDGRAVPLAAPLGARLPAAAADAATVLLLTALAVLGARLATGASPRPSGLVWVAGFVLFLSAFSTVLPLVAFGRTVGMALADLTARSGGPAGVSPGAAMRRWLGTLATLGTAGLLLLWTARDGAAPTPADRLSGCALAGD
jgi:hypothetical protein